jgi:hypothetical protein
MPNYTQLDALKHIWSAAFAAWAKSADMAVRHPDRHTPECAELSGLLKAVKDVVGDHIGALCDDDPGAYSDGRRTFSTVELTPADEFWWLWHPDPQHQLNQPGVIAEDHPSGDGRRWQILVADGRLSAVPVDEAAS